MLTDPNVGGVEKLTISQHQPDLAGKPPFDMSTVEVAPESTGCLPPLGCFMVKGWTRCVCALTVMLACYESEEFLAQLPDDVKQQPDSTVPCSKPPAICGHKELLHVARCGAAGGGRQPVDREEPRLVSTSVQTSAPGITAKALVRRKPNCFNLLFQMRLLDKLKRMDVAEVGFVEIVTSSPRARSGKLQVRLRTPTRLGGWKP